MKRRYLPLLFGVLLLLGALAWLAWLFFIDHPRQLRIEIPAELLQRTEESRYSVQPVEVVRHHSADDVRIFFPVVRRETRVTLYTEAGYQQLLYGDHHARPLLLADADQLRAVYRRPVLNFSNLPNGKYYVHLSSCNYGGFFCFALTTRPANVRLNN